LASEQIIEGQAGGVADVNFEGLADGHRVPSSAFGGGVNERLRSPFLSASDFGLLVGATGQSVYAWEAGKSKPRGSELGGHCGVARGGEEGSGGSVGHPKKVELDARARRSWSLIVDDWKERIAACGDEQLSVALVDAIEELFARDAHLLDVNVHENAIAAVLRGYVLPKVGAGPHGQPWDVDLTTTATKQW
jgi:hypothetical protein